MVDSQDSCFHESLPSVDLDLEYSDDESLNLYSLQERNEKPLPTTSNSLIVDELEVNHKGFIRKQDAKMETDITSVPSAPNTEVTACPCCLSYIQCTETKRSNNFITPCNHTPEQKSYFLSLMEKVWSDQSSSLSRSQDHASKTIASANLEYEIKSILMESWIEKKGSGRDLFGNKSWKSRWCQLALARVPNYQVDVPILLVSWHYSMPMPSTIIVLDEKLAISKINENQMKFCFDVVAKEKPMTKMMARTFSVSSSEHRDKWIQGINNAIQQFDNARKAYRMKENPLPPTSPKSHAKKNSINEENLEGFSLCLD